VVGPERKTIVKVVYSDESGTGGDLKKEPITVVAAMLLNIDSQWIPVRDAVEGALRKVYGLSDSQMSRYAIKGKNLYHKIERGDSKAMELVARLMAIPKQKRVPIWYGAVDRDGYYYQMENLHLRDFNYKDAIPPFRIAFEQCINRVDGIMRSMFPDEQVLWIHDAGSLDEHARAQINNDGTRPSYENTRNTVAPLRAKRRLEPARRNKPSSTRPPIAAAEILNDV
jgi:hypothetical protein